MIENIQSLALWNFVISLISILSFIISVWVLVQTYRLKSQAADIKQSIINKARVPQLHSKLVASSKKLSKLKSSSAKQPINECVAEIRVLADKLLVKIHESERANVSLLIVLSDDYLNAQENAKYESLANKIYIQLKKVLFSMDEYMQDERLN